MKFNSLVLNKKLQISVLKATLAIVYIIVKFLQALLYGWYGLFLTAEVRS